MQTPPHGQGANQIEHVPSRNRLLRNVAWNFAGGGAPLIAALFAVPVLIRFLGTERFGVLTLAWALIGYFSVFDFGLGRALTKMVSERLGQGRDQENPALIWTGLTVMALLGVMGGAALWAAVPALVERVLNVPLGFREESRAAFSLLAFTLPVVFATAALRGVLEAHHRFDLANLIRIPLGVWNFVAPLLLIIAGFAPTLIAIVATLVAGRVLALAAHGWACAKVRPGFFAVRPFQRQLLGRMFSFGGWITVSNVVGPIMVYFDRFFVGAALGVAAVAYYTTPYEVIAKVVVIPEGIVGVLFPLFAATIVAQPDRAAKVFDQGLRGVFILLFPMLLVLSTLAYDGLALWIDIEFARETFRIAQWLCAGILANAMARVPFAAIQAFGRPDPMAKLHLVELPIYLLTLWLLISSFGVQGAAAAWAGRAIADMLIIFWIACVLVPRFQGAAVRGIVRVGVGLVMIALGSAFASVEFRTTFLLISLVAFGICVWRWMLTSEERERAKSLLLPLIGIGRI